EAAGGLADRRRWRRRTTSFSSRAGGNDQIPLRALMPALSAATAGSARTSPTSPFLAHGRGKLLRQLLAVDRLDALLRHADDDVTEAGAQVPRGEAEGLQIALLVQRGVQLQNTARGLGDEDDLLVEVHVRYLLGDLPRLDELREVLGVGDDPILR